MKKTFFALFIALYSLSVCAQSEFSVYDQAEKTRKHALSIQSYIPINGTFSEEKAKNIFQGALAYTYRLLPFVEIGAGVQAGGGRLVTSKEYYFRINHDKPEETPLPYPINNEFIGIEAQRKFIVGVYGRFKMYLYENNVSPFFMLDGGYSFVPYTFRKSGESINMLGFYFTPSIGYDFGIVKNVKITVTAGFNKQLIKYDKYDSYYIVPETEEMPVQVNGSPKYIGIHSRFMNSVQLSVGFIYNVF